MLNVFVFVLFVNCVMEHHMLTSSFLLHCQLPRTPATIDSKASCLYYNADILHVRKTASNCGGTHTGVGLKCGCARFDSSRTVCPTSMPKTKEIDFLCFPLLRSELPMVIKGFAQPVAMHQSFTVCERDH